MKYEDTIIQICEEYNKDDNPWIIGYSGGKDSSAVIKLLYNSLFKLEDFHKKITIIYCDTGVEIPIIRTYAITFLEKLRLEIESDNLPIDIKIIKCIPNESYFSKVIGMGYMPPSFMFRWCTDKLRIKPLQKELGIGNANVILLGTRNNESNERNRILAKHQIDQYHYRQNNYKNSVIYSPIIDYSYEDVWSVLDILKKPYSMNIDYLKFLYKDMHESCNNKSGKGRFGCWTCTVVRNDHAMENLIKKGYTELIPLLEFRNWLANLKYEDDTRFPRRRNGEQKLGPFTLETRKLILNKLLETQQMSNLQLISKEEIECINNMWNEEKDYEFWYNNQMIISKQK